MLQEPASTSSSPEYVTLGQLYWKLSANTSVSYRGFISGPSRSIGCVCSFPSRLLISKPVELLSMDYVNRVLLNLPWVMVDFLRFSNMGNGKERKN
jgi:hypothetical protein